MPSMIHEATLISPVKGQTDDQLPILRCECVPSSSADLTNMRVYAILMTPAKQWLAVRQMTHVGNYVWEYQVQPPTTNSVITYSLNAVPASGIVVFSLFDLNTTPLPYDATNVQIQEAIDAMPDLVPGSVIATGSFLSQSLSITFTGDRAGLYVPSSSTINSDRRFQIEGDSYSLKTAAGVSVTTSWTQTVTTGDLPLIDGAAYGLWAWTAVGFYNVAPFYYSGSRKTPDLRDADMPRAETFNYSPVPLLNVTVPTEDQVFNELKPTFFWDVTQTTENDPIVYQEIHYQDVGTDGEFSQFLWATDATNPHRIRTLYPHRRDLSGEETDRQYTPTQRIFGNNEDHLATFYVRKASGQESTVTRGFRIQYTGPSAPTPFTATLSADKAYLDLDWATAANTPEFQAYVVSVRNAGTPVGSSSEQIVARIEDRLTTTLRIFDFPYNKAFTVAVEVEEAYLLRTLFGTPAEVTMTVPFSGTVVSEVFAPQRYVVLPARLPRRKTHTTEHETRHPWGQRRPIMIQTYAHGKVIEGTYPIYAPGDLDAERFLVATLRSFNLNFQLNTHLYRDAKQEMVYGKVGHVDEGEREDYQIVNVTFDFTELSRGDIDRGDL